VIKITVLVDQNLIEIGFVWPKQSPRIHRPTKLPVNPHLSTFVGMKEQKSDSVNIISGDIDLAAELLKCGEIVAIPTETVYGLAGNIFIKEAIERIFEVKERPLFNPLIVHVHSLGALANIVREFPDAALKLATAFWPGPLTLVLKKTEAVPGLITGGRDTVAVRIPNHPVALELLRKSDVPLAAPSANPFNRISPTRSAHVAAYFGDRIPMILEGGECLRGLESTIVGFEEDGPVLYRHGGLELEAIERVVGPIRIKAGSEEAPEAPGMLAKHYAPRMLTCVAEDVRAFLEVHPSKDIGVLSFSEAVNAPNVRHCEILSESGDLEEAAMRLYDSLHSLDGQGLEMIVAERLPDIGLGKAINDRLKRAAQ
jgi:L-threonylcarbamoyladenylate synthase